ncbi:MAG: hypothetical protein R3325_05305 [Thermoanaerobaculia bacterium]|nr:hypothetical protein [Thermoanaerobaculia bacterium]
MSRFALIGLLFLALAAFACEVRDPETGEAGTPPQALAGGSAAPAAAPPETGADDAGSDGDLGLFAPAFPGLGLDTHSTECDPFGNDSEVCF